MTKRTLGAAAAAALLAGCGGGAAPTTPMRSLSINAEASATLSAQDPRLSDNTAYQTWRFTGHAGDMVEIDVTSSDFDTYAILQDDAGRELAHDDDAGEGTNARIMYALPSSGTYRVVAKAYREGNYGTYRVHLQRLGSVVPGGNGSTIGRGQLMTGRLSLSDPRLSDNSVYHTYMYQGHAGEALTIDVMSSDFDAFAILQDPYGNEVSRDDDSGEGTDARIITTLRQTGIFRIIVNTYSAGASGTYTLWVH
jgi:serine protease Do